MKKQKSDPLSNKLELIVSSPVRVRIARLMTDLPEKEFTGREIARLLDVSHTSVQEAMRVLVASGFVIRRSIGRAHLYSTNMESYLYRALETLFKRERDIQDEVRRELRSAFGKEAVSVTVFGSYAERTAGPESDMDVLIVTTKPEVVEERALRLGTRFLRRYGIRLSAKVLTPRELRRKRGVPFVKAARAHGITITGKPLDDVI